MSETARSFITASAGTGKTYRLVEIVKKAILEENLRPEAIIATTFTCKAAAELTERLGAAFHGLGRHDIASRLERDALISTVHGVCFRLLSRFAFEAGISPDVRVLDEAESSMLLDRAIDEVVDESTRQRLYACGGRLSQRNAYTWTWEWRRDVREMVEKARSNHLAFDRLPAMAAASWREMEQLMGPPTGQDLEELIINQFEQFYQESATSSKKNTAAYVELVRAFENRCRDHQFPWSNWEKLYTIRPEKDLEEFAESIAAVAARVVEHPRLHRDIEEYLSLLFEVARSSGERFQEIKRARGVADFSDLEKTTLDLLRDHPSVREALGAEIELLLVDEFQDTSPIQLALFAELGSLAGRVVWVGDVKQSIYGFRGADPQLVQKAALDAKREDPLQTSWRSVPDLVKFCNDLFGSPFHERLGLPVEDTIISAHREPASNAPAIEINEYFSSERIRDGKPARLRAAEKPKVIADAVVDLLQRDGETVVEKPSVTTEDKKGKSRALLPGDVAVLVRRGNDALRIGNELRIRGFDVAMSGHGVLGTPEAKLALACLRRWLDPSDSLAAAEVVSLEAIVSVETWLEDRLAYMDELGKSSGSEPSSPWLPDFSPALQSLHDAAEQDPLAKSHSPLGAFDRAISAAGAVRLVSRWGPGESRAEQRLANLEQVRLYIQTYEDRAMTLGIPATVNGLFTWLDELAATEQDFFPDNPDPGAICVGTYHSAKGLEWPVVFLSDLDHSCRSSLYGLRVVSPPGQTFDYSNPLHGRELRKWIHPFGKGQFRGGEHPFDQAMENSKAGLQGALDDENEALRLLYVGMTRARDRLVLLNEKGRGVEWLDLLGADVARNLMNRHIAQPITHREFELKSDIPRSLTRSTLNLPRQIAVRTPRVTAAVTPSKSPAIVGATVSETIRYGERLNWQGHPDDRDLGEAMHRIFAAEILNPGDDFAARLERATAIFRAFSLPPAQDFVRVLQSIDLYRDAVVSAFQPAREDVEVPFTVVNSVGQSLNGYIDHLVTAPGGTRIIIDHKIFPGKSSEWEEKALSYSGQLAAYREVFPGELVTVWIHFATSGVLLRVETGA